MNIKKGHYKEFTAALISGLMIFVLFFYISSKNNDKLVEMLGNKANLYIYFLGTLICLVCFISFYNIYNKSEKLCLFMIHKLKTVSIVMIFCWCITAYLFEVKIYPYNPSLYLRHNIPFLQYLIFIILLMSIIIKLVRLNITLNKWIVRIFCISIVAIAFALMYAPNIFNDTDYTLYHTHAYINSIFNVLRLSPYDDVNCSIYGHYGMIYYLPVKIISLICGSDMMAVAIVIGIFGSISYAMILYCLRKLVGNDIVFCMVAIGLLQPVAQTLEETYYQIYPHRIFFPTLLIFAITIEKYKNIKFSNCLNWILVTLGIVWNVEIGMVCGAALLIYNIYRIIMTCNDKTKRFKQVFYNILYLIFSFMVSYMLVNLYNIVLGASMISLKQFIYPIGSSVYSISSLMLPLPEIYGGYILVLIVFLSMLFFAIFHSFINRGNEKTLVKMEILLLISTMGLGTMTYFMNRTAYANLAIVHFELMIILGFFIDKICLHFKDWKALYKEIKSSKSRFIANKWNIILGYTVVMITTCIVAASFSYIGTNIERRAGTTWRTQELEELYSEIDKNIPENTVAFGKGVPELFGGMNRKTNLYITDWSDMNRYSMNAIEEKVSNIDAFFAAKDSIKDIKSAEEFICLNTYNLERITTVAGNSIYEFGYYVRNVSGSD